MFRYKFYESRLNSFKVIVIIPLLPRFRTLIPGDIRGLLICFSMLSQQYILKFLACYEFVSGLYELKTNTPGLLTHCRVGWWTCDTRMAGWPSPIWLKAIIVPMTSL